MRTLPVGAYSVPLFEVPGTVLLAGMQRAKMPVLTPVSVTGVTVSLSPLELVMTTEIACSVSGSVFSSRSVTRMQTCSLAA